ncbi:MAG: hypothetical protein M3071_12475 [Actinomycetota bacterium]|nr:hypothetical protein [Actinomycetota bacterium]
MLEALAKGGAMTAAEVALATGLGRATASSTLSRLTRTGEVTKAERGYQLPDTGSTTQLTSTERAPKPAPRTRTRSTKAPSTPTASQARGDAGGPDLASAPPSPVRGATKAKVLAALSIDVGLTAGEVAMVTGLARGTVSTTLSKLAKGGEVVKADRGYRLPG